MIECKATIDTAPAPGTAPLTGRRRRLRLSVPASRERYLAERAARAGQDALRGRAESAGKAGGKAGQREGKRDRSAIGDMGKHKSRLT